MQGLRWSRLEQVEHRADPAQGGALHQLVESDRWKMAVACPRPPLWAVMMVTSGHCLSIFGRKIQVL